MLQQGRGAVRDAAASRSRGPLRVRAQSPGSPSAASASLLESRRQLFMSEKEKKEELVLKQRAELAIKKGTAELDSALEQQIAAEVLATLEQELVKLLVEEGEEAVCLISPVARKSIGYKDAGGAGVSSGAADEHTGVSGDASGSGKDSSFHNDTIHHPMAHPAVNIEDIFDINNIDALSDADMFRLTVDHATGGSKVGEEEQKKSNEFAAELLYIMRTSMALS